MLEDEDEFLGYKRRTGGQVSIVGAPVQRTDREKNKIKRPRVHESTAESMQDYSAGPWTSCADPGRPR